MENEKIKEVAETLKKQGLAASMYEAMEKAKSIVGEEEKIEEQKEKITNESTKRFNQLDYDISKEEVSVNELMKELGIDPDKVKEMEKEKIKEEAEILKEEIKEEETKEIKEEKLKELKEKVRSIKEEATELEEEQ